MCQIIRFNEFQRFMAKLANNILKLENVAKRVVAVLKKKTKKLCSAFLCWHLNLMTN